MVKQIPAKSQMSTFPRSARALTVLGLVVAATSTVQGVQNRQFLQEQEAQDELLMVVEVSRHGAREPSRIFNFTADPNQNFNGTGNIMPLGKKQHFELGQHMRQKYIHDLKLLSENYTDSEVYVQTTYKQRTYLSSLYQLMGLYPDNQPPLSDYLNYDIGHEDYLSPFQRDGSAQSEANTFNVTQIQAKDDLFLHVDKDNCARYATVQSVIGKSEEYGKVQKYFTDNFLQEFEKVTNTSLSYDDMVDVCGYIQWAQLANLTLNFTPTALVNQYCLALGDSKLYSVSYGLDQLWKLSAFQFLNKMVSVGMTFRDNVQQKVKLPKLIHYAAHAETLAAFFDGMGIHRVKRSFPGSALFFEFYRSSQGAMYVKLNYFNGDSRTTDPVRFPNQTSDSLEIQDFISHLLRRTSIARFQDVKIQCTHANFNGHPQDYYSGDKVLKDLEEAYQTTPVEILTSSEKLFLKSQ
eukprot:403351519